MKFRHQVPIGPYIADFVSYYQRLIIEIDGGQHALEDPSRTRYLESQGFRVLRFWNNEVLQISDDVLAAIIENILAR